MSTGRFESIKNGDILIEISNGDVMKHFAERGFIPPVDYVAKSLAYHVMICKTKITDETLSCKNICEILHSVPGHKLRGVKANDLIKDKLSKQEFYLGSFVVLRLSDKKLGELLVEAAERWVLCKKPSLIPAEEKKSSTSGLTILATPYVELREADSLDVRELFELYRAFRAYQRNMSSPTLPLSKEKGVSCNNFVFYSLKTAIINRYFTPAVLAQINHELSAIETIKEKQQIKKLKDFKDNLEHFNNIKKVVELFGKNKLAEESDSEFHARTQGIKLLFEPLKGINAKEFFQLALSSGLFAVQGYLFYQDEMKPETAAVLSINLFSDFKLHKGKNFISSIVVSKRDVEEIISLAERNKIVRSDRAFFDEAKHEVSILQMLMKKFQEFLNAPPFNIEQYSDICKKLETCLTVDKVLDANRLKKIFSYAIAQVKMISDSDHDKCNKLSEFIKANQIDEFIPASSIEEQVKRILRS